MPKDDLDAVDELPRKGDISAPGDIHRTDGVATPLRRAASGARWALVSQVAQQGLSVLATLILARLLTTADFGVVAAATTILALMQLILNLGLTPTVIRKPDMSRTALDSLWTVGVGLAVLAAGCLAVLAPTVGGLLGQDNLAPYLRVLAAVVVVTTAASLSGAMLQRDLRFREYHIVLIVSTTVYIGVQIVLALAGAGAMSVVLGQAAMSLVNLAGWSAVARYLPRPRVRLSAIKEDLRLTSGWLGLQVVTYATKNGDYWMVSRALGANALGSYYVAFVLPNILRQRLGSVTGALLFPVFAQLQDAHEATRATYVRVVRLQVFIAAPLLVGLSLLAEPVTYLFFGPQWGAAVEPLRLLSLAALATTLGQTLTNVGMGRGHVYRLTMAQGIGAATTLVVAGAALHFGLRLAGVSVAVLLGAVVTLVVQQVVVGPIVGVGWRQLIEASRGAVIPTGVLAVVVQQLTLVLPASSHLVMLSTCVVAGGAAYLATACVLSRTSTTLVWRDIRKVLLRSS